MQQSHFGLIHHGYRVVTFDDALWNLCSAGEHQDPAMSARSVSGCQVLLSSFSASSTAFAKSDHMTNTSWNYFCHLNFFFPGNAGKNPIRVADDIMNAIVDFTRKHSTPSLKKVKVVIFVTELLNVFYDSMKKREKIATSPTFQSTFSKAACKMFF